MKSKILSLSITVMALVIAYKRYNSTDRARVIELEKKIAFLERDIDRHLHSMEAGEWTRG